MTSGLLAAVAVFQHEADRPSRYLAVDPQEYLHAHPVNPAREGQIAGASRFAWLRIDSGTMIRRQRIEQGK